MQTRRSFVRYSAIGAAIASAAFGFASSAFATGNVVDVQLVDRTQTEVLPVYSYRGASWIAGRPGNKYAVRLTNRSGKRVLVVLSVDGVNAISGETAAVDQTGYVLDAYQSTEITGWRKNMNEAAAFYFTALPDSYAARTDRPDNVGVIGAAVFREKDRERELARERERQREIAREREMARRSTDRSEASAGQRDSASEPAERAPRQAGSNANPASPNRAIACRRSVSDRQRGQPHCRCEQVRQGEGRKQPAR